MENQIILFHLTDTNAKYRNSFFLVPTHTDATTCRNKPFPHSTYVTLKYKFILDKSILLLEKDDIHQKQFL